MRTSYPAVRCNVDCVLRDLGVLEVAVVIEAKDMC
jgi:hypothetical protein